MESSYPPAAGVAARIFSVKCVQLLHYVLRLFLVEDHHWHLVYVQQKTVSRLAASELQDDNCHHHQLPVPRMKYEIWIYSPWVEEVHLLFFELTRGGLSL